MSKTYYISSKGNDLNEGTSISLAWRSIDKVNQTRFLPGDSILFEGGEMFMGNLDFTGYGHQAESNPIYIGTYGKERAIIDAQTGRGIYLYESGGIHIENLIIKGDGREKNNNHGILIYRYEDDQQKLKNYQFINLEISGFNRGGISFFTDLDKVLEGFSEIRLHNIYTHHNGDHGISVLGRVRRQGHTHKNIYISQVVASHNYGEIGRTNAHTGNGIVVGNADSVMIEYCEAFENGKDNTFNGGGPVGIWIWDCNDGIIQFCESHDNKTGSRVDGGGFDLDGGCTNCSLQYNLSYRNYGAGYLVAEYNGARPLYENEVHHNISIHDGLKNKYGGIQLWKSKGILSNLNIYDNFIYTSGRSSCFRAVSRNLRNISVERNLFITSDSSKFVHLAHFISNLDFAKNLFHNPTGKVRFRDEQKTFDSLKTWTKKGQIHSSPGNMFDHDQLPAWINRIEDPVFGRSLLTRLSENQKKHSPVDWDSLLASPLPSPTIYPNSFKAQSHKNGIVQLQWSLPDAHQLKEMILERSLDSEERFQEIWKSKDLLKTVSFEDYRPYGGKIYYRLKLVGDAGAYQYSALQKVKGSSIEKGVIKISPGDVSNQYLISYPRSMADSCEIKIWDNQQNLLIQQSVETNESGRLSLKLETPLSPGSYLLQINDHGVLIDQKFVWE